MRLSKKGVPVALVLCTGRDEVLTHTRKLILEKAGHSVIATTDDREIITVCKKHRFDVAVIGQTVSRSQKRNLFSVIRENCPETKILELYPASNGKSLEQADSWLRVPADVPNELAEKVAELTNKGSSAQTAT